MPIIHIFGIICNIICTKIFSSNKFYNNIYRYLTANSIIDALFLLFFTLAPFTQCLTICEPWLNDYFINFYKKYGAAYTCRVLDTISSLINVSIVIDRLLCVNKIRLKNPKIIFIFSLIFFTIYSILLFVPNIILLEIKPKIMQNQNGSSIRNDTYMIVKTHYSKYNFICTVLVFAQYITSLLALLTVIICNIILIYQLNTSLKKSNNITKYSISKVKNRKKSYSATSNDEDSVDKRLLRNKTSIIKVYRKTSSLTEKKTTVLVIFLSVFFIINQIGIQTLQTAFFRMNHHSVSYNFIAIIHNICSDCFHGTNVFLYYKYSKEFSSKINKLFSREKIT